MLLRPLIDPLLPNTSRRFESCGQAKSAGSVERIIDVNLNRLTEALRVVEDVVRLALEEPALLRRIRALRTRLGQQTRSLRRQVIESRGSEADPGREDRFDRARRNCLEDILMANLKRAQEAARVLEEMLKLEQLRLAAQLKEVRFSLYDIEKELLTTLDRR